MEQSANSITVSSYYLKGGYKKHSKADFRKYFVFNYTAGTVKKKKIFKEIWTQIKIKLNL